MIFLVLLKILRIVFFKKEKKFLVWLMVGEEDVVLNMLMLKLRSYIKC